MRSHLEGKILLLLCFCVEEKKYKDYFEFLFRCQSAVFQAWVDVLRRILLSRDLQLTYQRCSLCPQRLVPESFLQHMLPTVVIVISRWWVQQQINCFYLTILQEPMFCGASSLSPSILVAMRRNIVCSLSVSWGHFLLLYVLELVRIIHLWCRTVYSVFI